MADVVELENSANFDIPSVPAGEGRPPLKGWVTKKKTEGSRSKFLSSANRRFFTVDFEAQVLYYGHTECNKQLSAPISFRDVLRVELIEEPASQGEESQKLARADSKTSVNSKSSGTLLQRMPSLLGTKRSAEHFGLLLETSAKTMELFFGTKADCDLWFAAFQEAAQLGSQAGGPTDGHARPHSTTSGTTASTPTPSFRGEAIQPDFAKAPESGVGLCTPTTTPLAIQAEGSPEGSAEEGPRASLGTPLASSSQTPPIALPEEEGEEQPDVKTTEPAAEPASWAPDTPKEPVTPTETQEPEPAFGPDEEPAVEEEEAAEEPQASKNPLPDQEAWSLDAGSQQPRGTAIRYSDKGEGLSIQERLAQLEFSDDEEDEEDASDPTRAARLRSARGKKERAEKLQAAIEKAQVEEEPVVETIVEQCQAFSGDVDSDDD